MHTDSADKAVVREKVLQQAKQGGWYWELHNPNFKVGSRPKKQSCKQKAGHTRNSEVGYKNISVIFFYNSISVQLRVIQLHIIMDKMRCGIMLVIYVISYIWALSQACYLLHQCSLFFPHSGICQEFKIFSHDSYGRHLEPSVTDTALLLAVAV